ncbi:prepilin-type N-terminal cleavage/methylation domain-containing protein [Clostridium diolis]|uniref:prepilin-type N-terminal cleavage/methylation domain-containing protein n=1 Tax=Clostridium diolis TaxID=223919 RepID=UPI003AF84EB1
MNQLLKRKNNELSLKKKKGFTLIELIIVIAIIAILAAIAIPKFGAAKHNADVSADQANAKIIATAVANAVAHGDIPDTTATIATNNAGLIKYIDGGKVPAVKSVSSGSWTISYDTSSGITVDIGSNQFYPIS